MTSIARIRPAAYAGETESMIRELAPLDQLREALVAADELERGGVAWADAWRRPGDWVRFERLHMLALQASAAINEHYVEGLERCRSRTRDRQVL